MVHAFHLWLCLLQLCLEVSYDTSIIFYCLVSSRAAIIAFWLIFILLLILPLTLTDGKSGSYLLDRMNPATLWESALVSSVYGLVIVLSLLDMALLRYLPWVTTSQSQNESPYEGKESDRQQSSPNKAQGWGYPDMLLLRLYIYGQSISSILQTIASVLILIYRPQILGYKKLLNWGFVAISVIFLLGYLVSSLIFLTGNNSGSDSTPNSPNSTTSNPMFKRRDGQQRSKSAAGTGIGFEFRDTFRDTFA